MRGCGSELEYNVEHLNSECGFLLASHYIFITINLKPEKKKRNANNKLKNQPMLCNGQFKPYRSVFNENKFTPNKKYYTKM